MKLNPRLPSEYQEVTYIESTGHTQCINTGVDDSIRDTLRIEIDQQINDVSQASYATQGVGNWGGYYGYYLEFPGSASTAVLQFGSGQYDEAFAKTPNDHQRHMYILDCIEEKVYVDSTEYTFVKDNAGGYFGNIFLFGLGKNNVMQVGVDMKLYSCKIYDGATKVRDFVPCYRISDSTIGVYDLVNDVFYVNAGTGTFTKGNDIGVVAKINIDTRIPIQYQELDFIQSTGFEYIDTDICIYNYYDKVKMEVDMQLTPGIVQNEYCYQGVGYAGSSGYYFAVPGFWTGNNDITVAIGDSNNANSGYTFTNVRDTNRHTIFVDAYNGTCGFDNDIHTGLEYSSITSSLGTGNINLFAMRSYSERARNFLKMCLYGCTITDMSTNTKLRDFVPCYRKSDNEVGLYDLVSETFFTNQGTGSFIKGVEKNDVEQITDSNGNVLWEKQKDEIQFIYESESANHYPSQGGDCLFDNNANTKWCANFVNGMKVYFNTNRLITPKGYSMMTGEDTATYPGRNPKSWKLYGKARMDEEYTLIDSRTNDTTMGATNNQWYDFQISNPNNDRYRYFYIEIDAISSGSILQISELCIYETLIPNRYQEVEYIGTTDGTSAYINTGFTTSLGMKIEIDAQALGTSELFIGAMPISASENSNFTIGRVNDTMGYMCWNNQHYYGNYGDWSTRSKVTTYQNNGSIHYIFNDNDIAIAVVSSTLQSSANLYLFRRNDGGSPSQVSTASIKLYGCKLWLNDTLSRNFIPCYRKSDNEIGLYDLITGTFYTNAGTGTFTKGNDV